MNLLRILTLGALLTTPLAASAAKTHQPVAIVYGLAGDTWHTAPDAARRPSRLYDRLPAETTVEVGPGSRLELAFVNGLRYELGKGSRVRLGARDLTSRTGTVRRLPAVPPLPPLPPIAPQDRPGLPSGAPPIRGEPIKGLYPRRGAAVLANATVLYFQPVTGASRYRIEVQDGENQAVFQTEVESPPVKVPAGTLPPGNTYRWTVRTLDRPGAIAHGKAELVTLGDQASRAREKARKILEVEGAGSLPLLAEIDRSLGLWLEAREELKAALREKPSDPALREALGEIATQLENEDDLR